MGSRDVVRVLRIRVKLSPASMRNNVKKMMAISIKGATITALSTYHAIEEDILTKGEGKN
jgi:hypothetical protein